MAKTYGENFKKHGGTIHLGFEVQDITQDSSTGIVSIKSSNSEIVKSDYVLTCAGLQSDRVAALTGSSSEPKIVPFRGEYLLLNPEKAKLINGNIYPVPDPAFPFLGVHFTPRLNGEVIIDLGDDYMVNDFKMFHVINLLYAVIATEHKTLTAYLSNT